ncbi:MAG: hypothetical protein KTR22_13850 [Flavobacteriaceae bacterium]|nr:hypothetical protein [Flavobacteriaceae bacterium]
MNRLVLKIILGFLLVMGNFIKDTYPLFKIIAIAEVCATDLEGIVTRQLQKVNTELTVAETEALKTIKHNFCNNK